MVELSAGHLFLCWSQRFSHHLRVARHTVSQTKPFQSSNLHCPTPNVLLMDLRRHHGIHQPRYQRTGLLRKKSIPPLRRRKKGGFHFPEIHQLKFKLKLMKPRKWEAYFLDANIRFFWIDCLMLCGKLDRFNISFWWKIVGTSNAIEIARAAFS